MGNYHDWTNRQWNAELQLFLKVAFSHAGQEHILFDQFGPQKARYHAELKSIEKKNDTLYSWIWLKYIDSHVIYQVLYVCYLYQFKILDVNL